MTVAIFAVRTRRFQVLNKGVCAAFTTEITLHQIIRQIHGVYRVRSLQHRIHVTVVFQNRLLQLLVILRQLLLGVRLRLHTVDRLKRQQEMVQRAVRVCIHKNRRQPPIVGTVRAENLVLQFHHAVLFGKRLAQRRQL